MTYFRMAKALLIFAGALGMVPSVLAVTCSDSLKTAVQAYQTSQGAANDAAVLRQKLAFGTNPNCLVAVILANPAFNETTTARVKAAFQQTGSNSGSSGSTSIVSKGTAAQVLSVATEYGALTESVSGQTITVGGTLAGVPTLIERTNILQPCGIIPTPNCISFDTLNALSRFSYSVAFNASSASPQVGTTSSGSSSSTQPTTFRANYQSINAVTAKAVILRGASATPGDIGNAITKIQSASNPLDGSDADKALTQLQNDFNDSLVLRQWGEQEFTRLTSPNLKNVDDEYNSWSQSLPAALCTDPNTTSTLKTDVENYLKGYYSYLEKENAFLEGLRKAPVITAEYDWNLPTSQPSNSTIRAIGSFPAVGGLVITANGAGSFYNGNPSTTVPGARILRDFQAAAEFAYTFGTKTPSILGQSTASVAYYYQDQTSPSILNITPGQPVSGVTFTGLPSAATQVFAQRGVINLAQMKFNFIPGKGSINIPLSVTWSNRTELVTQPVWRGQVGISYDFDSLFSGLGK